MRNSLVMAAVPVVATLGCASQSVKRDLAAQPATQRRTILVDSFGYATAAPDRFVLDAEVTHRSKDLDEVRARVATAGRAILEAVKPFRLAGRASHAGSVRLSPETAYQTGAFLGYEMSQQFHFVLDDVSKAEALTEAVLRAGATSLWTQYTYSRRAALAETARVRAARDARKRAEVIAAALGMRVGRPVRIEARAEQASVISRVASYDDQSAEGAPSGEVVGDDLSLLPPQRVQVEVRLRTEFELLPQAKPGQ